VSRFETAYALKQITDAGVRVLFCLEDPERTLETAMDKVMLSLTNCAAEMEREKARPRTRDAMHRKASRGYVAGGKVYGYPNVEIATTRPIVNEYGTMSYVKSFLKRPPWSGASSRRSLKGAGSVASRRDSMRTACLPLPRGRGWVTSGVRELVLREFYRGRVVWGKTRWIDRGGTKVKQDAPESDWLIVELQRRACAWRDAGSLPTGKGCCVRTRHTRARRSRRYSPVGWCSHRAATGASATTTSPARARSTGYRGLGVPNGDGAPGVTRTPGKRFRKPLLCPPELRGHAHSRGAEAPVYRFVPFHVP
jgi:resolvase-like protein/recombinase